MLFRLYGFSNGTCIIPQFSRLLKTSFFRQRLICSMRRSIFFSLHSDCHCCKFGLAYKFAIITMKIWLKDFMVWGKNKGEICMINYNLQNIFWWIYIICLSHKVIGNMTLFNQVFLIFALWTVLANLSMLLITEMWNAPCLVHFCTTTVLVTFLVSRDCSATSIISV